jgi:catechol 2,3-dioxygenase-like lactoylglutathione lyase family enzyme
MEVAMITSFSHVYLPVPDVDAAVQFYTSTLGFRLLRKWQPVGGPAAAYAELGGVLLEIVLATTAPSVRPDDTRGDQRFGLTVDDLDATLADLSAKGVETVTEPFEPRSFWGRQAVIRDPFGYRVALRQWRAPDGPRFDGWQPARDDVVRLA